MDFLIVINIVSPFVLAYALGRYKTSFDVSILVPSPKKKNRLSNANWCKNWLTFVAFLDTHFYLKHWTFLINLPSIVTQLLSVPCDVSSFFYFCECPGCFKVHLDFFPPGHLSVSLLEYLGHFLCCSIYFPHYFPSICKKTPTAIF